MSLHTIREIISEQWLAKHTRIKTNGVFEIRCNMYGTTISASGKTLDIATENFIAKLVSLHSTSGGHDKKKTKFDEFALEWMRVVKQPTVKANTYQTYMDVYGLHVRPFFKNMPIAQITAMQIQPLFTKLTEAGKMRTAQYIKNLLNQIFTAAVGERIIQFNPMDGVRVLRHNNKKGVALTIEEEKKFIADCKNHPYGLAYMLLLYGGMRRGELREMQIGADVLIIKDGKKRIDQVQTSRRVPITPMLAPYLKSATEEELQRALMSNVEMLTRHFKELCPDHHLHELRHTFITRCQECGVPREVVSVWVGHVADRTMTSSVYTHFSDEFMKNEGKKVDYYNRYGD